MDQSRVMDIFAYYLSEYDMDAFGALGFDTRTSGFEGISALYGKKANYLKRLRDEYDVVTSSERMGQRNRPPRERIKETARQLSRFSFDELTELAKALMEGAVPFEEHETQDEKDTLPAGTSEETIESILNAKDPEASIRIRVGANKVRVYKTSIIKQLKKLYGGQCQLCGCRPFEKFDADICEAHHIDYFSSSKNNDAENIIVLCPNHHRLIHKMNPVFNKERRCFVFPDGTIEEIKVEFPI